MPAKSRSPAPGRRSGAPSGGGTSTSMKRRQVEELLELPALTTLPDGDSEHFIGGWSALDHVATSLTAITQKLNAAGTGDGDAATTTSNHTPDAEEAYLAGAAALVDSAIQEDRAALRRLLEVESSKVKGKAPPAPQFVSSGGDGTQDDDDRAATSGPSHRIIVLPRAGDQQQEVGAEEEGARDHVAWVTHGLVITGLLPSQSDDGASAFNDRIQAANNGGGAGLTEDEEGAEQGGDEFGGEDEGEEGASDKGPYFVKFRAADAKDDEEEDDEDFAAEEEGGEEDGGDGGATTAVEHDEAIAFVLASKRAELRRAKTRGEGRAAVTAAATGAKIPAVVRRATVVDPTNIVQVPGPITFQGLRPRITVAAAEITPEAVYAAAGLPPPNVGGKAKRRTDEEKAREVAAEQKLVEEAAAQASAEEQRLSQFADPTRWPSIVVSRLAFVAPSTASSANSPIVTVKGAHVHFVNCHFSGAAAQSGSNLCAVTAHCKVTFTRCSFVAPTASAIYAYQSSNVTVSECVFTAAPQPSRFFAASSTTTSSSPSALDTYIFAPAATIASLVVKGGDGSGAAAQTVGVHGDGAKVTVRSSHFEGLDVAVLMRGIYKPPTLASGGGDEDVGGADGPYGIAAEPNEEGHRVVRPKPAHTTITENTFVGNASALCFVDARRTAATKNACMGSTRYDVQCLGPRCTPQILRCNLQGRVYISEGSTPFMHSNHLASVPLDSNATAAQSKSVYSTSY